MYNVYGVIIYVVVIVIGMMNMLFLEIESNMDDDVKMAFISFPLVVHHWHHHPLFPEYSA